MELKPRHPPGHANRKLRGYVSEIGRLRSEGHTIRAIHEALLDAGVKVGWGTVQREVKRLDATPAAARSSGRQLASTSAKELIAPGAPERIGSPIAAVDVDAHFGQHITNPLFKASKGRTA